MSGEQFLTAYGTVWQGFADLSNWATGGYGQAFADTAYVREGAASIRLTNRKADGSLATSGVLKKSVSIDLSAMQTLTVSFYIPDLTKVSIVSIYLCNSTTSTTNSVKLGLSKANGLLEYGWNTVVIPADSLTQVGTGTLASTINLIYLAVTAETGQEFSVTFDSLVRDRHGTPIVVLTFDGAWEGVRTSALPLMAEHGMKGNVFAEVNTLGDAGHLGLAGLGDLHDAGWYVGGHSVAHLDPSTLTESAFKADTKGSIDYLKANGFPDAGEHYVYPYGKPLPLAIDTWCTDLGIKTARGTVSMRQDYLALDVNRYRLRAAGVARTSTAEAINLAIDRCVSTGSLQILFIHDVLPDELATEDACVPLSTFTAIIEHLAASGATVLTMPELYAIYRSWQRDTPGEASWSERCHATTSFTQRERTAATWTSRTTDAATWTER